MRPAVVNVRSFPLRDAQEHCVYVGRHMVGLFRGHPLANPFRLGHKASQEERLACLERYRDWLHAREDLQAQLRALYAKTKGGRIPLGCWCAPQPCHADVLADLLGEFPELEGG